MAEFPTKRIINLDEQSAPQSGDYIVTDNQTNGTKKTPASALATSQALAAEATARQQADEAEAQARTEAISAEQTAREQAIEAEQTAREEADDALTESVTALSDEVTAQGALIQNPTKTVSGNIAHFTDGAEMPAKSVIVNIEPQQSGTGTPSPDNVRQISGWESVSVKQTGKNLLATPYYGGSGTSNGITWTVNDDGTVTANGTATADSVLHLRYNDGFLPYGQYIFNGCPSGGSDNTYFVRVASYGGYGQVNDYGNGATFDHAETDPVIANRLRIILTVKSGTTLNNTVFKPMIRAVGSSAEYEPYNGTTTTTSLGRTVYGGTLDVVSGVLTAYPFYPSYNGETLNGRWICDRAVYAEGTTPPTGSQVALISGTGTTYQLTPTEVKTLLGENNVWADAGAVEVTYRRDINLALEQLEALLNGTEATSQTASTAETSEA